MRSWEYQTLVDIVGKLVKYGSISEKQEKFVGKLVEKIDNAKAIAEEQEAKKAAEREAAEDAPEGRVQITGRLVSLKETCSQWGVTTKGLIVDDRGFKVWGTIPAAILDQIAANLDEHERRVIVWNGESKGRPAEGLTIRVELTGTVKRSDTDRQFGFYSRPAKASCEILEQDAK